MSTRKDNSTKAGIGNRNALKHGAFSKAFLLPEEDPKELRDLRRKLNKDLHPQGETEHLYFEMIVTWAWRLLRSARWIKAHKNGEDFELMTEIEIPARLSGEFDKSVRRFFQARAMKNMFRQSDKQDYAEVQPEDDAKAPKALPIPNRRDQD